MNKNLLKLQSSLFHHPGAKLLNDSEIHRLGSVIKVASETMPQISLPFIQEMLRMLQCNGKRWTVKRLKNLYQMALSYLSGGAKESISWARQNGLRYSRTGLAKGHFKGVFTRAVRSKDLTERRKFIGMLRSYTIIFSDTLSREEEMEELSKIPGCSRSPSPEFLNRFRKFCSSKLKYVSSILETIDFQSEYWYRFSDLKPYTSTHTRNLLSKEDDPKGQSSFSIERKNEPYFGIVHSMLSCPNIPSCISFVPTQGCRDAVSDMNESSGIGRDHPVGHLSIIAEPGLKYRLVAVPTANIQYSFTGVANTLRSITRTLFPEEDCIQDQKKGVNAAMLRMALGRKVHCIDLSSATNNFPRELQLVVLEVFGMQPFAQALEEICLSPWEFHHNDGTVSVHRFERGQRMGLHSSIQLFQLSHLLLLDFIRTSLLENGKSLSRFLRGSYFYVIGDDVITSDSQIKKEYLKFMREWNVPISLHKSFSSKTLCEFGGHIILGGISLRKKQGRRIFVKKPPPWLKPLKDTRIKCFVTSFVPYKWPKRSYISNSYSFCLTFRTARYLSKSWDRYNKASLTYSKIGDLLPCESSDGRINYRQLAQHELGGMVDYVLRYIRKTSPRTAEYATLDKMSGERPILPEGKDTSYLPRLPNPERWRKEDSQQLLLHKSVRSIPGVLYCKKLISYKDSIRESFDKVLESLY